MSDSFTEMVERYRKELAQYGAQSAKLTSNSAAKQTASSTALAPASPETNPAILKEAQPTASPEPQPATTKKADLAASLEPAIPEKTQPVFPIFSPEPQPAILENAQPTAPIVPISSPEPQPEAPEEDQDGIPFAKLCHPDDSDTGTLVVQVYTARQAVPVPDADVSVYCGNSDSKVLIAFRTTNEDGKTDPLLLAAPSRALAETPEPVSLPYAVYRVRIDHPEYISVTLEDVQMFGGAESILPVELTPYIPADEPKPLRTLNLPEHSLSEETEGSEA